MDAFGDGARHPSSLGRYSPLLESLRTHTRMPAPSGSVERGPCHLSLLKGELGAIVEGKGSRLLRADLLGGLQGLYVVKSLEECLGGAEGPGHELAWVVEAEPHPSTTPQNNEKAHSGKPLGLHGLRKDVAAHHPKSELGRSSDHVSCVIPCVTNVYHKRVQPRWSRGAKKLGKSTPWAVPSKVAEGMGFEPTIGL